MTDPRFTASGAGTRSGAGMDDLDGPEARGIPDFLRDPRGTLQRRWRWMLLAWGLCAVATAAVVSQIEPIYVANATIQVTDQQIPKDLVRSTIADDPLARINAMLGTILSRREISTLIETYGLYPELRDSMPFAELVERTRGAISIEEKTHIGSRSMGQGVLLYSVSFESNRPGVAADVANEIAGRLTLESARARTRQATVIAEFLKRELDRAEADLRRQSQAITAFKEANRGELPGELQTNLSKMDRLQMQRQSLSLQIAEAETRLATLATAAASSADQEGSSVEERLVAARQQLARELATRTESHPDVVSLRRKIEALEQEAGISSAAGSEGPPSRGSLLEGSRRTIAELKSQLAETDRNLRLLDAQVAGTPARQERLIALEEEESVLREKYLEMYRKVQEAELALSLESTQHGERFAIIDPAVDSAGTNRRRLQVAGLGTLASFALAIGIGLLLEIRDPVLASADQLEALADLPVLGSVPRI